MPYGAVVKAAAETVAVAVAVAAVAVKVAASADSRIAINYVAGPQSFGDLRHFSYFCALVIDELP